MGDLPAPARYFPVDRAPLQMRARLRRFPVDCGNGLLDQCFFQVDDELPRYRRAKASPSRPGGPAPWLRWSMRDDTAARAAALDAVRAWIEGTLGAEAPAVMAEVAEAASVEAAGAEVGSDERSDRRAWWWALSQAVQEDLVVMHRGPAAGEPILMHVCFPSAWRPQAIAEADFQAIHGPVPGFVDAAAQAVSMFDTMVERGPYLRFVWSLVADDVLDHHPDEGGARSWEAGATGFLRVERQLTVPFPAVGASLFIIRTVVRPFAALTSDERAVIAEAVAALPPDVRVYKGMAGKEPFIAAALAAAEGGG